MLTGLLAPTSGTMRILDADLAAADAARTVKRRVGVVPEDLALFDNLTAREYLTFIGRMYLLPAATVRGAVPGVAGDDGPRPRREEDHAGVSRTA